MFCSARRWIPASSFLPLTARKGVLSSIAPQEKTVPATQESPSNVYDSNKNKSDCKACAPEKSDRLNTKSGQPGGALEAVLPPQDQGQSKLVWCLWPSTHVSALEFVMLEDLQRHALAGD
jgi:hypothetical protein